MAAEKTDRLTKNAQELRDLLAEAAPFVEDNNYGTDASAAALTKRIKRVLALVDGKPLPETNGAKIAKQAQEAFAKANGLTKPEPKPLAERKPNPQPKKKSAAKKK